jgi:folylpolyglutamate synthase
VAGTKGKGSTCAFAESLLRAYGSRTGFPQKTGLYTSPHLISYEERIRIDKAPISRDLFAKYFFEVWDKLLATDEGENHLPRHFQLLALVSMHAFIREGVQAVVYETHHGGEYDATNVIAKPIVTIVTSLGMDHVRQLGPGIENIAWHKAGIFKQGADAFSAEQDDIPARVLRERAEERKVTLEFVQDDNVLAGEEADQLKPDIQRRNCALALTAVKQFLNRIAPSDAGPMLQEDIRKGVEGFSWPGRFQLVEDGNMRWFLEGAHNEMSITKAAEWFTELAKK